MNIPGPARLLIGLIAAGMLLFVLLAFALKYHADQQVKPIREIVEPALKGIDIDQLNKNMHDYTEKHRNDAPAQ
jgi:hypothetical protein